MKILDITQSISVQSAGVVEYTDFISAERYDLAQWVFWILHKSISSQSVGAVEYTDRISAER